MKTTGIIIMKIDQEFIEKYDKEIAAFREICLEPKTNIDPDQDWDRELNFFDFSVGFFIALGVTDDWSGEGRKYQDAFVLATLCRYEYDYWVMN